MIYAFICQKRLLHCDNYRLAKTGQVRVLNVTSREYLKNVKTEAPVVIIGRKIKGVSVTKLRTEAFPKL